MAEFVPQQNQIVTRLLLVDMARGMAEINALEELRGFPLDDLVLSDLPTRNSDSAFLWLIVYYWHNGY